MSIYKRPMYENTLPSHKELILKSITITCITKLLTDNSFSYGQSYGTGG